MRRYHPRFQTLSRSNALGVHFSRARLVVVISLSGCLVGPDYLPPKTTIPAAYVGAAEDTPPKSPELCEVTAVMDDGSQATASSNSNGTPTALLPDVATSTEWWKALGDSTLNGLIDRAVASNLDLRTAALRVRVAREELTIARGGLFPTVSAEADYTRSHPSGINKSGGSNSESSSSNIRTRDLFHLGFDAAWELDLFGGLRREVEQSEALYQSQVEAERGALISLLGEVAQNYVLLRGYQRELAIAQQNADVQTETANLQRAKVGAGLARDLTLAQAEAQLASTLAVIPTLERQVRQSVHRLGILIDREPEALLAELHNSAPIPTGPAAVPAGLPSDLLRHRPDIRQAERVLAAATANIGIATAELFPKFNLTGSLGWEDRTFASTVRGGGRFWNVGSVVTIPLFFDTRLHAYVRIREAAQQEAFLAYRKTVLTALGEVEDALMAHSRSQQRRDLLQHAVDANRRALEQSRHLADAGVADFLNVLNSQQSLFQSEDQLVQSEVEVTTSLIALYKALGGGWENIEMPVPNIVDSPRG